MDLTRYIHELDHGSAVILNEVKGLSPSQLQWKDSGRWSILQILEHICLTDQVIWSVVLKPSEKIHDQDVILGREKMKRAVVEKRDIKVESPEVLRPKNIFSDLDAFTSLFLETRGQFKLDLFSGKILPDRRVHRHLFLGDMTISDWLYFMIHHTERHLEQIKDLKPVLPV